MKYMHVGLDKIRINKTFAWHPPQINWVKLNFDGACKPNRVVDCEGVLRDENGRWLGGYSEFLGCCTMFTAEMRGLFKGLKLTISLGYQRVEVNVDFLMVVQVINNECSVNRDKLSIVSQIKKLMAKLEDVRVLRAYKEINKCVNVLVGLSCVSSSDTVFYMSAPDCLLSLLDEETRGVSFSWIMSV